MSAGDVTQGRRVDGIKAVWDAGPGSYALINDGRVLWMRLPCGDEGRVATDEGWSLTEHDDGTVTVTPSIHLVGRWHGYLERGVWREV